jgi:hypothetical protein
MAVRLSALRAGWPSLPRKIPGTHFCQRLNRTQGHSAAGRITSIEKSNDLTWNRIRYLPACSIVPQPTTLYRGSPIQPVRLEYHMLVTLTGFLILRATVVRARDHIVYRLHIKQLQTRSGQGTQE